MAPLWLAFLVPILPPPDFAPPPAPDPPVPFPPEAVAAWERYLEAVPARGVAGTATFSRLEETTGERTGAYRTEFAYLGDDWASAWRMSSGRGRGYGANPDYVFTLNRRPPLGFWEAGRTAARRADRPGGWPAYFDDRWRRPPFGTWACGLMIYTEPLPDLIGEPGFAVLRLREEPDGQVTVHFRRADPPDPANDVVRGGWFRLDPARSWLLTGAEVHLIFSRFDPGPTDSADDDRYVPAQWGHGELRVRYADAPPGEADAPPLPAEHLFLQPAVNSAEAVRPLAAPFEVMQRMTRTVTYGPPPTAPDRFRLPYYGVPEPTPRGSR